MEQTFNPAQPYPRAMQRFPTLRQTWLSRYDECGLTTRFDLEFRKGWSTHPMARGTLFHRFAGRALREMAAQRERTIEVDVALAILHEVLRQEDIDRVCPECFSRNIRHGITRTGMRTCGDCKRKFETEWVNVPMAHVKDLYWVVKKWAHDNEFDIHTLYSVEERLRATLRYGAYGGVERVLTGQTDALFRESREHVVVLDWKDMWKLPAAAVEGDDELGFHGYFQQRFYGWLVMKQPEFKDVERVTLREFYVRYSEPREATLTRTDLDDVEAELAALAERFDRAYEENVWTPTAGKHCNFCMRPSACPLPVFARDEGRITSEQRAKVVAASLVVAEKIVKDNRAALKAYTDLHGPIPLKSAKEKKVIGFRRSVTELRPTREQLTQAILRAGDDMVDIDSLYVKREQTKFGVFTPGPEDDPAVQDAALLERLEASVAQAKRQKGIRDE